MTRDRLRELLDRGAEDVAEVDFVDAAWQDGMGIRRRRRVLAATGLTATGAGALALALAVGGGLQDLSAPQPAVPPDGDVSTATPTPTPLPTVEDTAGETTAPDRLELAPGSIAGIALPAPGEEVVAAVEEHLGPQFDPPGPGYYPDFGDATGCEAVGLVPGPGEARFAHWEVDGTTLYVRGREVEGEWEVDTYEVREDAGALLALPFDLRIGMPGEEALAMMPEAEERQNQILLDAPTWHAQDDVHVFTDDVVSTVQFGPLHCAAPDEQVNLAAPATVGVPAGQVLPGLADIFGEAEVRRTESAPACGGRPLEQHFFGAALRIDVTTDPAGTPVVDGWSVTGNDGRIVMSLDYRVGMTLEEAQALAWTPDPGTVQEDGTLLLRMGRNDLVFSDEDSGRTLQEVRSIPILCTADGR